jgi:hypothetical protein
VRNGEGLVGASLRGVVGARRVPGALAGASVVGGRREGGRGLWTLLALHRGNVKVRAEPFEAFELELGGRWEAADGDDEPEND